MSRSPLQPLWDRFDATPQAKPTPALEMVAPLSREISDLFTVEDATADNPGPDSIRLRGHFLCDPISCYDELRRRFERHGYTPFIRQDGEEPALFAVPIVFDPPASNPVVNLLLLLLTILSTLFVGAQSEPGFSGREIWLGIPFSFSIMLILGAHELGHYFAARYHRVPVTLPYFIPMPLSIIGTMGAFIRLKAPIKNRRALFDIGAAGPLAGLLFALPILVYGLATSPVNPLPSSGYLLEGNSLLYKFLKYAVFGQMLPDFEAGIDVTLNQYAWAGWVGLLVTGINLIPVGQLDGGHIAYVLLGRHARKLFWPVILGLAFLAVYTGELTWGVWVFLLFFLGTRHAQPLDDVSPVDTPRLLLAVATLALFVLVFVPTPIKTF
jgi:membrane-associated protease RseP (regulator of RpoE activity)